VLADQQAQASNPKMSTSLLQQFILLLAAATTHGLPSSRLLYPISCACCNLQDYTELGLIGRLSATWLSYSHQSAAAIVVKQLS
jgi:hypothetical protein